MVANPELVVIRILVPAKTATPPVELPWFVTTALTAFENDTLNTWVGQKNLGATTMFDCSMTERRIVGCADKVNVKIENANIRNRFIANKFQCQYPMCPRK